MTYWATQVVQVVKKCLPMQETEEMWIQSWVRKIPWRRKWQPAPVFLPEESHGQRSLVGYGPWGHKESDTDMTWLRRQQSVSASIITYYFTTWGKLLSSSNWDSHIWREIEIVIIVSVSLDYCENWVIFYKDLMPRDLHVASMLIIVIVICVLQETLILLKLFGI